MCLYSKMYWKEVGAYILAFTFSILVITYLLNIPALITQNPTIVRGYYYTRAWPNLLLDLFFVAVYLLVAAAIIKILKIEKTSSKFVVVIATTLAITSGWCFYFRSQPMTSAFFSQWFNTVGYSSALYDAILIGFTYLVYERILEYL